MEKITTVIIGHGRKHRKINVDYNKTYFIDKDPKCEPDLVVDFAKNKIESSHKFQRLMFICSARMILQVYSPEKRCEILLPLSIQNILVLLKLNGYLYTTNVYSLPKNITKRDQNFIQDISSFGFELIGREEIQVQEKPPSFNEMMVFKKIIDNHI